MKGKVETFISGSVRADELVGGKFEVQHAGGRPGRFARPTSNFDVHLDSAGIQASDLLAWYSRRSIPNVAEELTADQYFTGRVEIATAWPLELDDAAFSSYGGEVRFPGMNRNRAPSERFHGGRVRFQICCRTRFTFSLVADTVRKKKTPWPRKAKSWKRHRIISLTFH